MWTLKGRIHLPEPLGGRRQLEASEIPDDVWRGIAAAVKARWATSSDWEEKHALGDSLKTIYAARLSTSEILPFMKELVAAATAARDAAGLPPKDAAPAANPDRVAPDRAGPDAVGEDSPRLTRLQLSRLRLVYLNELFERLLEEKWTKELEEEAFATFAVLAEAQDPDRRLFAEIEALHKLTDAMLAGRLRAAERRLSDEGGTDKLTRKELASKHAEFRRTALEQLAERLKGWRVDGELAPWVRAERAWLELRLNRNLAEVEQFCWQVLGEKTQLPAVIEESLPRRERTQQIADRLLKRRGLAMAMNLAARRTAAPEFVDRVLRYLDSGVAIGGETANEWRQLKYRMLIALDRPDDLERELRGWIRTDVSTGPWRQSLARLLAERGRIDEAIPLFEACEKDRLLTAADVRTLADWHLVAGRRADHERTKIESIKLENESNLVVRLNAIRNRWSQTSGPLPTGLDDDTLLIIRALYEKSSRPEGYFWQVRDIYAASRDFRVLERLPDALLGRTPQQVYSTLATVQSSLLSEVRNEATADEIVSRIAAMRKDRTPTDLRALDLLEALVERKASEVTNQPGP
ncbi:MAG TPA: hypothetical protein PLV92_18135, partial [Pirellulaceae bacterium]|nr:hypothetical protein [Pirellulaceae bacterium]